MSCLDLLRVSAIRPEVFRDVVPLLRRLHTAFGLRQTAALLDTSTTVVSAWRRRADPVPADAAWRIVNLHEFFACAYRVLPPQTLQNWLVGEEPFLNYRRPIDVLLNEGICPVTAALRAKDAEVYG